MRAPAFLLFAAALVALCAAHAGHSAVAQADSAVAQTDSPVAVTDSPVAATDSPAAHADTAGDLDHDEDGETPQTRFDSWRRACAYLHNESCSERNATPGPCTHADKCLRHVCTPGKSGSCADDPTLSFCEDIDCNTVMHVVRQLANPLGRLSRQREPVVVE